VVAGGVVEERDFDVVRGVGGWGAGAAAVGGGLTVPTVSQRVVLTRLGGRTAASMPARESVAAFAAHGTTMAVFLSAARPAELQQELLAGGSDYAGDTPAAIVVRASWPDEPVVTTTLRCLAAEPGAPEAPRRVLVRVGPALRGAAPRAHLYAPQFAHKFRRRSPAGSTVGRPA